MCALDPLRALLGHADQNVVQASIVAIGHLGDARAIPDLLPVLEADPWLQMAAVQALGDLRSPAALAPLCELLTDLMLGRLAAEALAHIGGTRAAHALARHWLRFRDELEPEATLGLLAHVLEGLPRPLKPIEGLREALAGRAGAEQHCPHARGHAHADRGHVALHELHRVVDGES